ncbi:MAG: beta-propeller domain-containing protein [Zestosphaera sp.]
MNRAAFVAIALVALVLGISLPLASSTLLKGLPGSTQTTQIIHSYLTGASATQRVDVDLIIPGLKNFSSYDDLAQYLRDMSNLKALVDRLMYPATTYLYRDLAIPVPSFGTVVTVAKEGVLTTTTSVSKTNVQVEGVDEPDMVKTNGRLITVASGNKVFVVGVTERRVLSTLILRNDYVKGLFLYDDELIIITESPSSNPYPLRVGVECRCLVVPPGTTNTTVYVYNVAEASNPVLLSEVSVTGTMLNSRIAGSNLYLVVNMYFNEPAVPLINNNPVPLDSLVAVDQNPNSYTIILALDLESLNYAVYTFITGGGSWLYMTNENLYVASEKGLSFLEVYISVLRTFVRYLPNEIASNVSQALESGYVEEALGIVEKYLAGLDEKARDKILAEIAEEVNKEVRSEATVFYVFSVNGLEVKSRGSFEVMGMLLDQFSMEEIDGFFITATTSNNYSVKVTYEPLRTFYGGTKEAQEIQIKVSECDESGVCVTRELTLLTSGGTPGIPYEYTIPRLMITTYMTGETSNNVFTVDLESLQITGSLRGLASGERIYSARLIGDVFFLVTFRQVDPLFAIDVSDPENLRILGYLKIPGFSEYLHPLPNGRLLGIGLEDSNLKISLFDVTDPTSMREISTVKLSPAWSPALYDHHAVTVNLDKDLVLIPVSSYAWSYASGGILAVTYSDNTLRVKSLLQHDNALRSLYVGEELFTVSTERVKVYDLNTLKELGEIQLKE